VTLTSSQVTGNLARQDGGGIYGTDGASVTLTRSVVRLNLPDNCAPPASVPGCTG
jgi:predicted outer membrane repeat protein